MMIRDKFTQLFEEMEGNIVYDFALLDYFNEILLKEKSSIPRLFRYSSADYYNIRALETETLFLSPIGNMNDIFEGLSCEIDDAVIDKIEDLQDIAYLKSFSEEKNNLLMWAHYAKDYSGMCVEYDFSKLSKDVLCHLYPIYYSKTRSTNRKLDKAIEEHIDLKRMNDDNCYPNDCDFIKDILSLFLTKSDAWSYEKEWRIIATHSQIYNTAEDMGDDQALLYAINTQNISVKSCIKSIYLGARMKKNIKEHIKEICRDKLNNIPVYSTRLSKNKYELDFILEGE